MSVITAFDPRGYTASLTTNSTASTANSTQISATALGFKDNQYPGQVRVINHGTDIVWLSFTSATAVIAVPTAYTNGSGGTPTQAIPVAPGIIEVFTLTGGPIIWVNDISATVSQTYFLTFGEGV